MILFSFPQKASNFQLRHSLLHE